MRITFKKLLNLLLSILLICSCAHADMIIQFENGRFAAGQEVAHSALPPQSTNPQATLLSRDKWIDGRIAAPVTFPEGTLQFWLNPLDWQQGEGWRTILNWRSFLSGPDAGFDTLWVRSDPKGNIIFLIGNVQKKKWDTLIFALPQGTASQWTNLAFTWDKESIMVYADGLELKQIKRVYQTPLTLGTRFKLGGPHGSGVEQGSEGLAFLALDNKKQTAQQILQSMQLHQEIKKSPLEVPKPIALNDKDLLDPAYGATAYASSFSLEFDPRKVLQCEPNALWKPEASDEKPRFYITWPGDVVFDQLTLDGEIKADAISLFTGESRLDLKQQQVKIERNAKGQVTLTLALANPICARVMELHFTQNTGTTISGLTVHPGDASKIIPTQAIALPKAQSDADLGKVLLNGQSVRFKIDSQLLTGINKKPWLLEVEQNGSEDFGSNEDFRAARALMMPETSGIVDAHISSKATSGKYTVYLSRLEDAQRTKLGTLQVKGQDLPQWAADYRPGFPQVKVDLNSHRLPNLIIDGKNVPVVIMVLAAPSFDKIAGYKQTGSRIWRFNLSATSLLDSPDIPANVDKAIAAVRSNIKNILALAPDTYIMIGLDMRPRAAWIKQYPDALQRTSDGTKGYGVNYGVAQVRKDMDLAARLFTETLAKEPYANHIVSLMPYFGRGGDGWGYGIEQSGYATGREKIMLGDVAPDEEAGFQTWLESKYGKPLSKVLSGRWSNEDLSRDTFTPSDLRLAAAGNGLFIDPQTKQDVIDYWKFRGESVADAINGVGEAINKASGGKILCGSYYGYSMASLRNQAPGVTQLGGHFDLYDVLKSSGIDIVTGGSGGDKRDAASNYELSTPIASAKLHGKLSLLELDNRTPYTRGVPPFEYYQLFSFDNFIQGAQKDAGFALTRGAAIHWYDMSSPHDRNLYFREPWYLEDSFFSLVQHVMKVGAEPMPTSLNNAPVAMFIDEKTIPYQDAYDSFVYENLLRYLQESMAQAGVGYRIYILDDYDEWSKTPEAGNTKIEIFLNNWLQSDEAITKSPRTQLWFYGANLLSPKQINPQPNTSDILGYDLKNKGVLTLADSKLTLTDAFRKSSDIMPESYTNHPYSAFHETQRLIFGDSLAAYFAPDQNNGFTTLAHFADGTPGLIQSQVNGHQRFFSSLPYVPTSVLREIYHRAGIELKVPFGDWWVAAGNGIVSINTQKEVQNPQTLQSWLKGQKLIFGDANKPVKPAQSYVVEDN